MKKILTLGYKHIIIVLYRTLLFLLSNTTLKLRQHFSKTHFLGVVAFFSIFQLDIETTPLLRPTVFIPNCGLIIEVFRTTILCAWCNTVRTH